MAAGLAERRQAAAGCTGQNPGGLSTHRCASRLALLLFPGELVHVTSSAQGFKEPEWRGARSRTAGRGESVCAPRAACKNELMALTSSLRFVVTRDTVTKRGRPNLPPSCFLSCHAVTRHKTPPPHVLRRIEVTFHADKRAAQGGAASSRRPCALGGAPVRVCSAFDNGPHGGRAQAHSLHSTIQLLLAVNHALSCRCRRWINARRKPSSVTVFA